ncbi:MAG: hypothetical protein ACXVZT_03365 [Terriglobales bacterium]
MPVARIVTPNIDQSSQALNKLIERLQAAGYEVEIASPEETGPEPDLLVEIGEVPAHDVLEMAVGMVRDDGADLLVAPGVLTAPPDSAASHVPETHGATPAATGLPSIGPAFKQAKESVVAATPTSFSGDARANEDRRLPDESEAPSISERESKEGGVIGHTVGQLGAALADGSAGVRDALSGVYKRVTESWSEFQQRRAETVQALRQERDQRALEREQERRRHEVELQRQAEEKQRLLAQRERVAQERERVLREQMAQDSAQRAEQERAVREALAREAARRAEEAHAAEPERLRLAALEAERLRVIREREAQRAAALAAERAARPRDVETLPPSRVSPVPALVTHAIVADAMPVSPPRLVPTGRRSSQRERQWQRAAFVASIATLAAMIGFAIAANRHPNSPLPASLMQNEAQQQVPFGPARMDVSTVGKAAGAGAAVPALPRPSLTKQAAQAPSQVWQKPSAGKSASRRNRRHVPPSERDTSADDEVVVRHLQATPQAAQRAQKSSGVRRYSDEN